MLADKVRYADTAPWPTEADGGGKSLQRLVESTYGNDPANWIAGGRSPGVSYAPGAGPTISQQPANTTALASLTATFR